MIFRKMTQYPGVVEKKICVEIWDKQIGQEPILIEERYFSVLKDALEYFYKEHE